MNALTTARGGRKTEGELELVVVRKLEQSDVPVINGNLPQVSKPPVLGKLRHTHHLLAQALAKGMSPSEASLCCGYSLSRISILQGDPAFSQLVSHYSSLTEVRFVDAVDRLKGLGLSALDEIQERLEEAPESFSNAQLLDMAELGVLKPLSGNGSGGPPVPAANIEIRFISAPVAPTITIRPEEK